MKGKDLFFGSGTMHCFFFILTLLSIVGCGGGTISTGSNSGSVEVKGIIQNSSKQIIKGAEITDLVTGVSVISNREGLFELKANLEDDGVNLLVKHKDVEGQIKVQVPEASQNEILLEITVDKISGAVVAVIVDSLETHNPNKGDEISQTFKATITSTRDMPLKDVKLSIPSARVSAKTNSNGKCSINTQNSTGKVKFSVVYKGVKGSFSLKNIPDNKKVTLNFHLKLSIDEGEIDPITGKPKKTLNIEVSV
jgi:hypothetical protein